MQTLENISADEHTQWWEGTVNVEAKRGKSWAGSLRMETRWLQNALFYCIGVFYLLWDVRITWLKGKYKKEKTRFFKSTQRRPPSHKQTADVSPHQNEQTLFNLYSDLHTDRHRDRQEGRQRHVHTPVQLVQQSPQGKCVSWHHTGTRVGIMLASRCAHSSMWQDTPSYTRGLHNTAVAFWLRLTGYRLFFFNPPPPTPNLMPPLLLILPDGNINIKPT